jgi:O-antigen/teichoic acid export membrane protein
MGVVKKQSLQASLITYVGVLMGVVNVFIVFPYFLDKETIGLIKSLEAVGLVVVPFVYLGIPFAINKFYPVFKDFQQNRLKSGMTYMFLILIFNTLLVSVLFVLFRSQIAAYFSTKSPLLSQYILLAIPGLLGFSWLTVFSYIASSNLKMVIPRISERILIRVLQIMVVLFFYFAFISEKQLIYLIAFSYLVPAFLVFWYVKKNNMLYFDFSLIKKKEYTHENEKNYVSLLTLSMIGGAVISNAGMVIIGSVLGLDYVAVFFIAFYMGFILDVPAVNFSQILKPVLAESLEKGDAENVKKLYQKSAVVQTMMSGFLFLLISANINEIFAIMPNGHLYQEGKWVVIIISLGYVLKNLSGCHFDILIMSKYYRLSVGVTVLMAMLTVVSFYAFTSYFGFIGAAYAAALTTVVHSFLVVAIVYGLFKLLPVNFKNIQLIVILAFMSVAVFFLPALQNPFLSVAYKSVLISAIYLPTVYFLKISEDVNEQVKSMLGKFM